MTKIILIRVELPKIYFILIDVYDLVTILRGLSTLVVKLLRFCQSTVSTDM